MKTNEEYKVYGILRKHKLSLKKREEIIEDLKCVFKSQSTSKELQCSKECELVKCQDLHDKNKELQKENKHLKQVYEHRCNEVKDKVETIHNYLNQITLLKKEIDKSYEALNDIVWLIERGASMDEVIESVNEKARPFLLTNKKEG